MVFQPVFDSSDPVLLQHSHAQTQSVQNDKEMENVTFVTAQSRHEQPPPQAINMTIETNPTFHSL